MSSIARKHLSMPAQQARRRRWQDLVAAFVATRPGDSLHARCIAAEPLLGVGYKSIEGYVGGATGKAAIRLPEPNLLAAICAAAGWNPLYVLYGPPHPERMTELAPRADLAAAVAAYVETALTDDSRAGRLPALGPLAWRVDGAAILAAAVLTERAQAGRVLVRTHTAAERRSQLAALRRALDAGDVGAVASGVREILPELEARDAHARPATTSGATSLVVSPRPAPTPGR